MGGGQQAGGGRERREPSRWVGGGGRKVEHLVPPVEDVARPCSSSPAALRRG